MALFYKVNSQSKAQLFANLIRTLKRSLFSSSPSLRQQLQLFGVVHSQSKVLITLRTTADNFDSNHSPPTY